MTEYEKMTAGMIYDPGDPEIMKEQSGYLERLWEFNRLRPGDTEAKDRYMHEVFRECGTDNYIELPFYANWGGHNVHMGSYVYLNFGVTLVDDGHIYIGDHVMFGPNVTVATAAHPLEAEPRSKAYQYNADVHIEENVWIGAAAVILPGVTIGRNSVIGAGSVVTKDIPDNVVAVGNPCRIIKKIDCHGYSDLLK